MRNDRTETTLLPIETLSLRSLVERQVRQAILSGVYQPGERLVESTIADQLGVSRAPVREVLSALEKEGLVVNTPRRGSSVVEFSAKDIDEIYSLRILLEVGAVYRAIPRITDEEIQKMQEMVDFLGVMTAGAHDPALVVEHDLLFHEAICESAQHGRLLQVWRGMRWQTQLLIGLTARTHYDRPEEPRESHQKILVLIRKRDAAAAADFIQHHLIDAQERALRSLSLLSAVNGLQN
jgi:DNA-binding GntR family transcriptional regulator